MFLGNIRGLPLEEFAVADTKSRATVIRRGGRYLLPIARPKLETVETSIDDLGVDVRPTTLRVWGVDFLILRCDELSLFDKTLAPRLLMKASANAFIAYEKNGGAIKFYARSQGFKKGLLPTSALILHSLLGVTNLSAEGRSFSFEYYNGTPHLSAQV